MGAGCCKERQILFLDLINKRHNTVKWDVGIFIRFWKIKWDDSLKIFNLIVLYSEDGDDPTSLNTNANMVKCKLF